MITPSPTNTAAVLGIDHNGIHWTDLTRNVSEGCERVSPACEECWAEGVASTRLALIPGAVGERYRAVTRPGGGWNRLVVADPARIAPAFAHLPRTVRGAGDARRRPRVWVGSMTDLFHRDVPFAFLDAVFAEMEARPWIDFQVLTKRTDRMADYAANRARRGLAWPQNVWPGTTVEDQRRANERIHYLLRVRAAVRFLSVEPMLGPIDLRAVPGDPPGSGFALLDGFGFFDGEGPPGIHQVIIGSESDGPRPGKRKTDPAHVLDLVDQCDAAGVAVFVKQLKIDGRLCALPMINGRVRAEFPDVTPTPTER